VTYQERHGPRLLTPRMMPPAQVDLEHLPGDLKTAATGAISIEGYVQPTVEVAPRKPKRQLTPDERQAITDRLRQGRKQALLARSH
jgi:hypothetical protein